MRPKLVAFFSFCIALDFSHEIMNVMRESHGTMTLHRIRPLFLSLALIRYAAFNNSFFLSLSSTLLFHISQPGFAHTTHRYAKQQINLANSAWKFGCT